jgi:hypothetical protein
MILFFYLLIWTLAGHGNVWIFPRVLMIHPIHLVRTTIDIHFEGVLDSVTAVHCFLTLILDHLSIINFLLFFSVKWDSLYLFTQQGISHCPPEELKRSHDFSKNPFEF